MDVRRRPSHVLADGPQREVGRGIPHTDEVNPVRHKAASRVLTAPEDIRKVIQEFEQVGLDEMVFLPQVTDLDQVDKLAEIVG